MSGAQGITVFGSLRFVSDEPLEKSLGLVQAGDSVCWSMGIHLQFMGIAVKLSQVELEARLGGIISDKFLPHRGYALEKRQRHLVIRVRRRKQVQRTAWCGEAGQRRVNA